jgi:hypothetical protein
MCTTEALNPSSSATSLCSSLPTRRQANYACQCTRTALPAIVLRSEYKRLGDHDTYSIRGDNLAAMRLAIKRQAGPARRAMRYRKFANRAKIHQAALKKGKSMGEQCKPILASMKEHVAVLTVSNGG